jgi:hypothetical protein
MKNEPASLAEAALVRRLRLRWQNPADARAEVTDLGVAIYWRGEYLGTWLAIDRHYEFRPGDDTTNGVVAHTILGAVAFTEGIIQSRT